MNGPIRINSQQEPKVVWRRLHRSPLPIAVGDKDPHLTTCSLGPQECSPQTGSGSVQPFLHSLVEPRDRQTN